MLLRVGTSGFSYAEWKGSFYPQDLAADRMLSFYAERLPSVEINNTFYRMPKREVLERWAAEVPDSFRFVLKASQRITHIKRLKEVADDAGYFFDVSATLGDKLGPALFQLPPNMKQDLPRLETFLGLVPAGRRIAIELRHPSWFDDSLVPALAGRAALVLSDSDEEEEAPVAEGGKAKRRSAPSLEPQPLRPTADFGYLRLRRRGYDDAALARWAEQIRAQPWKEVFVFFKHEDEGTGPRLAARFREIFG